MKINFKKGLEHIKNNLKPIYLFECPTARDCEDGNFDNFFLLQALKTNDIEIIKYVFEFVKTHNPTLFSLQIDSFSYDYNYTILHSTCNYSNFEIVKYVFEIVKQVNPHLFLMRSYGENIFSVIESSKYNKKEKDLILNYAKEFVKTLGINTELLYVESEFYHNPEDLSERESRDESEDDETSE